MKLVLSLFPGIDLLGKGFEQQGYCVVRGPELFLGQDIRDFHPAPYRFDGIIGGSPCQDFSKLRREAPTGNGVAMIREFIRVVMEAQPDWWVLENVPGVPDVQIDGYSWQRFDLRASEFGLEQGRLRHFQYGNADGHSLLRLDRPPTRKRDLKPAAVASDTRRDWGDLCAVMGLPSDFLQHKEQRFLSRGGKYHAVGNGVPLPMGDYVARACAAPVDPALVKLCACGCGRSVSGKRTRANAACRKRIERAKDVTRRSIIRGAWSLTDAIVITGEGISDVTQPADGLRAKSHVTWPMLPTHVRSQSDVTICEKNDPVLSQ